VSDARLGGVSVTCGEYLVLRRAVRGGLFRMRGSARVYDRGRVIINPLQPHAEALIDQGCLAVSRSGLPGDPTERIHVTDTGQLRWAEVREEYQQRWWREPVPPPVGAVVVVHRGCCCGVRS
jgi:hypothetical protein